VDALEFLNAFAEYVEREHSTELYEYAGYTGGAGALLLKVKASKVTVAIRPWERTLAIGRADVIRSDTRYEVFRGHEPQLHIHVGGRFRDNAVRYARNTDRSALVVIEPNQATVGIVQSGNIPKPLLDALLAFCSSNHLRATYDFTGTLLHEGFTGDVAQAGRVASRRNPRVFLSYSWDSEAHRRWVLKLAADLIRSGVHVLVDEWDLPDFNDDLHLFMESGIRDSDFVLLVCTPRYAERANARKGGVGVESAIITGEFYEAAKAGKFLPIIRKRARHQANSAPSYLKTRYAIDFTDDPSYRAKLDELLRRLFGQPRFRRPELGPIPQFESESV